MILGKCWSLNIFVNIYILFLVMINVDVCKAFFFFFACEVSYQNEMQFYCEAETRVVISFGHYLLQISHWKYASKKLQFTLLILCTLVMKLIEQALVWFVNVYYNKNPNT